MIFNESTPSSDHLGPPVAQISDYIGIGFLSIVLCVGGPLNLLSLFRSLGIDIRNILCGTRRSAGQRRPINHCAGFTLKFHLILANSLVIWVYVLSEVCWRITYEWKGGDALCRLVRFVHAFCFYATSNLVSTIALDRLYIAIRIDRPGGARARRNATRWFARCAWTLALVCSLPQLYVWRTFQPFPDLEWRQCVTMWVIARYHSTNQGAVNGSADTVLFGQGRSEATVPLAGGSADTVPLEGGAVPLGQSGIAATVPLEHAVSSGEAFSGIYEEELYNALHLAFVFWLPVLLIGSCYGLIVTRFNNDIRKRSATEASSMMGENEALSVSNHASTPTMISQRSRTHKWKGSKETMTMERITMTLERITVSESTPVLECKAVEDRNRLRFWHSIKSNGSHENRAVSIRRNYLSSAIQSSPQKGQNFAATTLTKAKKRTVRNSVWILLAYLICWSPYNVLSLWRYIDPTFEQSFLEILNDLIVLNTLANPLIYGI